MSIIPTIALKQPSLLRKVAVKMSPMALKRCYSGMVDPWKPGPYPKTKEDYEKAAARYGMIPEDYKPVSQEEDSLGDYPDMPKVGYWARDPYADYEYPNMRREYGEPWMHDFFWYTPEKVDPNEKYRYTEFQMFCQTFGVIGFFVALYALTEYYDIRINQTLKPKQFPGPGKVHYLFEPEYE